MSTLASLLLILLFLALGMLLGRTRIGGAGRSAGIFLDLCLYALLFSMGLRIGESESIRSQIARVGIIASTTALLSVLATALVVGLSVSLLGRRRRELDGESAREPASSRVERKNGSAAVMVHLKDPIRLFAAVLAGLLVGYLVKLLPEARITQITTWLLYLLVFLIGFQLVRSGVDIRRSLLQPRTLIVPAGAVVGTLASGFVLAPLLGLAPGRAMSVAAGFGWYSLSGVLITNLGDPVLGSAAFIANMLREGLSLLLIPLLGRLGLGEIAVGIAGATSMDVTLPLIGKSCGGSYVPLAVASGATLSFLVPILVPLLYQL